LHGKTFDAENVKKKTALATAQIREQFMRHGRITDEDFQDYFDHRQIGETSIKSRP